MEEHYQILAYIDDLEDASRLARDRKLSGELVKRLDSIRGDLVELELLMTNDEDYERLTGVIDGPLESLRDGCRTEDEAFCQKAAEALQGQVYELKNVFGLETAKALINGNSFSLISTADETGKVDTAFCGSATIVDDKHVAVAWLLLNRTAENLEKNKNATIIGFRISEASPMETGVARVYCTLESADNTGPVYDGMKAGLEKELGKTVASLLRKAYIFRIDEIRVSAPSTM